MRGHITAQHSLAPFSVTTHLCSLLFPSLAHFSLPLSRSALRCWQTEEVLDEANSWYCSRCQTHRQARKTLQFYQVCLDVSAFLSVCLRGCLPAVLCHSLSLCLFCSCKSNWVAQNLFGNIYKLDV